MGPLESSLIDIMRAEQDTLKGKENSCSSRDQQPYLALLFCCAESKDVDLGVLLGLFNQAVEHFIFFYHGHHQWHFYYFLLSDQYMTTVYCFSQADLDLA